MEFARRAARSEFCNENPAPHSAPTPLEHCEINHENDWTTAGTGPRFGLLVHHDDADREWAYARQSHIGRLDRGLDEGSNRGWTIVSMRSDWKSIFPAQAR